MQLFEGLEMNTHLESLSLTNVGLNDKTAQRLADAVEKNSTLKVLKYVQNYIFLRTKCKLINSHFNKKILPLFFSVETNFISPPVIVRLIRSLLKTKSIEEFRCSNQVSCIKLCTQTFYARITTMGSIEIFTLFFRGHKYWVTRLRWKSHNW